MPPTNRAELADHILASFEFPAHQAIDAAWGREVENRLDAFARRDTGSSPAGEIFKEIDQQAQGPESG